MIARRPIRRRAGHVLLTALLVMAAVGTTSIALVWYQMMALRVLQSRHELARAHYAALGVETRMHEYALARVTAQYGWLTPADLEAITAFGRAQALPAGLTMDTSMTRAVLTRTTSGDVMDRSLDIWETVPTTLTTGWTVVPVTGTATSRQTSALQLTAGVMTTNGMRRVAVETDVLAVLPAYPNVLTVVGDADLCAPGSRRVVLQGQVQVLGTVETRCGGAVELAGSLVASAGVTVPTGGTLRVATSGGWRSVATQTRPAWLSGGADTFLAATEGRVRVGSAAGSPLVSTVFAEAGVAGRGECAVTGAPCAGQGPFAPSVTWQHTTTGLDNTMTMTCGAAWGSLSCDGVHDGVRYVPFPFTTAPASRAVAWMEPTGSGTVWQGLFPDPRREARCTATVGGRTYRTYRCSTNAYGYVVDLQALGPLPGGVLMIQPASGTSTLSNPSLAQEVVVLTHATELAGPLTIVSALPVYLVGSFNTVASKPAMIDAPIVTMLPAETASQLGEAARWDSTGTNTPMPLQALSSISVVAVIRTTYTPTIGGGTEWGGLLTQSLGVVGDFHAVHVALRGALEVTAVASGTPGTYSGALQPPAAWTDGASIAPAGWVLQYDPVLATRDGTPKGSWFWVNVPPDATGPKTRARQQWSGGGPTLVRSAQSARTHSTWVYDTVAAPNAPDWTPPVGTFTVTDAVAGHATLFNAGASTDPTGGGPVAVAWDFGGAVRAQGTTATHAFASPGTYPVTVWVVARNGLVTATTQSVTIAP